MEAVLSHLQRHVVLSKAAGTDLADLVRSVSRRVEAGQQLVRPSQTGKALILTDGWIIREISLSDGRQQVTALFLPGDIFDLNTDMLAECGYTLRAVTEATVAELARGDYERLAARNPDLGEALTWGQLEQIANQTEWLANLGQRSAIERLAHFFCEIYWRLNAVGRARGDECDMPLTQHLLAEVLGMTPVHLNRSLQQLRESGIIDVKNKKLRIIDGQALADRGMFDADYLELKRAGPTNL